jgi:hypothetical protein
VGFGQPGVAARRGEERGLDRAALVRRERRARGDELAGRHRHRAPEELERLAPRIVAGRDGVPERDDHARPPAHERVVGERDRQESRRAGAADERREAALHGADLAVRGGPSLREEDERRSPANERDEPAKVVRRPCRPPAPVPLEPGPRGIGRRHRAPQEVGVLGPQHVARSPRTGQPERVRAGLERAGVWNRGVGALPHQLAEPGHARAADRVDLNARKPAADPDAEEQAARGHGQLRGKAGQEARQEHVVAGRERRAPAPQLPAAPERRAEDRDVGLAPVRDENQRPGSEREPAGRQHGDPKGGVRVRPHAAGDRVVEQTHGGSMAS